MSADTNKTIEEIIQHKKRAIRQINNLMESYISSNDPDLLKKTDLLSYWIETYTQYISSENSFEPSKLIRYRRGDVLRVNFGFRIGHEIGGLHFAVVLDKNNVHNASVITVIPLSSTDGRTIHPENVDLGVELYTKATNRQAVLKQQALEDLAEITSFIELMKASGVGNSAKDQKVHDAMQNIYKKQDHLNKLLKNVNNNSKELQKMKSGSMAIINQITTVSKQRIYTPKKSEDFLYNVSLSDTAMDKINEKIISRIIYKKPH